MYFGASKAAGYEQVPKEMTVRTVITTHDSGQFSLRVSAGRPPPA